LIDRTRAAGYNGALEVGQDLTLIEIGDSIQVLRCPPVLAAVTSGAYQTKISAGDTVIAWGSGFSIGGNALVWTPVSGGGPSVVLSDSDGRYFWDQSNSQINASLPPAITPGTWYVQARNDCIVPTAALRVTVN
jgi:hypothetical protein